jgi:hypothetical protein
VSEAQPTAGPAQARFRPPQGPATGAACTGKPAKTVVTTARHPHHAASTHLLFRASRTAGGAVAAHTWPVLT